MTTNFVGKTQRTKSDLIHVIKRLLRLLRRFAAHAGFFRLVLGPGVVPRHKDFKNLDCQTALSASTGTKSFFRDCKTGRLWSARAISATGKSGHSTSAPLVADDPERECSEAMRLPPAPWRSWEQPDEAS